MPISNQEMNVIGNFREYETLPLYSEEVLLYQNKLSSCNELWNACNNNKHENLFTKPIKSVYIGKTTPSELKQIK